MSRPALPIAGALVLVAAAGLGAWLLRDGGPPPPIEPDAPAATTYTTGGDDDADDDDDTAGGAAGGAIARTSVRLVDVTAEAGIDFHHTNGSAGAKLLPETMGPGAAFFDKDGDGDADLLLVNGRRWDDAPGPRAAGSDAPTLALYENDGRGHFTDVTEAAGLAVTIYGMGAACADADGDGDVDVLVTAVSDGNRFFENAGDGTFRDVTDRAGLVSPSWTDDAGRQHREWSTSAAWLDADGDGWLDLFVCNYVQWSPENDVFTSRTGIGKSFTTPELYVGQTCRLYRNCGDGRFEDVTEAAGVLQPSGKSLGVAIADLDRDGRPDIVVANDTQPNYLYRNEGEGRFIDVALEAGIAYDADGRTRGAMGIDVGAANEDGRPGILIGNFSHEPMSLYELAGELADRELFFVEAAQRAGLSEPTLRPVTFGVAFCDVDLDGRLDVLCANGHIEPQIAEVENEVTYAQSPQLFLGREGTSFVDATSRTGADLGVPMVGRGLAVADVDGDGDADVLITACGGPPRLLRNDAPDGRRWLRVRLRGRVPNTDAIGARVAVTAGGRTQDRTVRTGSSYLSQSELTLGFGLGLAREVERLEVTWPDGTAQVVEVDGVDRLVEIEQP